MYTLTTNELERRLRSRFTRLVEECRFTTAEIAVELKLETSLDELGQRMFYVSKKLPFVQRAGRSKWLITPFREDYGELLQEKIGKRVVLDEVPLQLEDHFVDGHGHRWLRVSLL